jgi:hypothetical protein
MRFVLIEAEYSQALQTSSNMPTSQDSQRLPRANSNPFTRIAQALTNTRVLWILFSVLVVLVWGPRMFRSFWVDEAGTFWMAHDGFFSAIRKTWNWPGQSVLYSGIASLFCFSSGPLREFALRIPSVLGMAIAGYYLYKLTESAIGPGSGLVALILMAFHPDIVPLGTEARPYGLGIGAVAASCWYLYQYTETANRKYVVRFVFASLAVIYMHYLFGVIFLAQAGYLLYLFITNRRTVRWGELLAAFVAIALLSLPLLEHIRLLMREAHTLPLTFFPTVKDLVDRLISPFLAFGLLLSALAIQFGLPGGWRSPAVAKRSVLILGLGWWLIPPVLLFALSIKTPMRLFVPRYFSYSILAQVLLFVALAYSVLQSRVAQTWAMLGVLLSTASPLSISAGRARGSEELKPSLDIIRSENAKGTPPPILFSSPLPETNFEDWRAGAPGSHAYAPFVAYPVPNRILLLPYRFTDEVKQHVAELVRTELRDKPEVLFMAYQVFAESWESWLLQTMKDAGYTATVEHPNGYYVILFRRAANRS